MHGMLTCDYITAIVSCITDLSATNVAREYKIALNATEHHYHSTQCDSCLDEKSVKSGCYTKRTPLLRLLCQSQSQDFFPSPSISGILMGRFRRDAAGRRMVGQVEIRLHTATTVQSCAAQMAPSSSTAQHHSWLRGMMEFVILHLPSEIRNQAYMFRQETS